jgi:hypothetical protein
VRDNEICREWKGGEGGRLMGKCYFRVRKYSIYSFFLSASWLNRFGSVRFNRFQTLETETESNQNFFVIF